MLTLIGILIIVTIVALLMMGKLNPIIAMSCIPVVGFFIAVALMPEIAMVELNKDILTDQHTREQALAALAEASWQDVISNSFKHLANYVNWGIVKVASVASMFLFAILFFSIMKDLHIFDPLIRRLVSITRGNVIVVCMITALVAAVVHLDGSGAATFLIIIPALLPLYKRLGMSPYLMLLIMCISMGVMNMVPWGGPLGRASSVTNLEVSDLWRPLILVQVLGILGSVAFAAVMGVREKRRIVAAAAKGTTPYQMDSLLKDELDITKDESSSEVKKPVRPLLNSSLIVGAIICLAFGLLPATLVFMIVLSLALLFNYSTPKEQMQIVSKHAPQAISMVAIILAAGIFLGVLDRSGMLKATALNLTYILPDFLVSKLHVVVGILGVPLDLFTSTDAYYYGLLPIVQNVTVTAGVNSASVVHAMAIGNNAGTFVSPFSPAAWLAMGLAGTDMGKHLRYSFGWIWLFSFFTLGIGAVMGLY
ncbi:SLC13 family permease [Pseudomonas sp. F1_0610]|uniref:CitMHS family transporter n=1 Tax=Pseudomonas sp. F1_0610 TaxID=3114284 RepID=UPI0039C4A52F